MKAEICLHKRQIVSVQFSSAQRRAFYHDAAAKTSESSTGANQWPRGVVVVVWFRSFPTVSSVVSISHEPQS